MTLPLAVTLQEVFLLFTSTLPLVVALVFFRNNNIALVCRESVGYVFRMDGVQCACIILVLRRDRIKFHYFWVTCHFFPFGVVSRGGIPECGVSRSSRLDTPDSVPDIDDMVILRDIVI